MSARARRCGVVPGSRYHRIDIRANVRAAFDANHGGALTPGQFNRYLGVDLRIEIETLLRQTRACIKHGRGSHEGISELGPTAALTRA